MKKRKLTDFGKLVNDRLAELNMTQKELSRLIGTSEPYLSMILHGERSGKKYKEKIIKILRL
ncbi:helix-turn-helix protein [Thermoanaerobacter kivui]|uniref:Helix-turn-helix protein n=1 Tax=Thermoanaerobacter kivui TaxID=2325 RepID=A0A097ATA8_THEKI|nr:helix-turn-helix transcriptional regulator [Thermoanaerobacter kivui]AIS53046.1 helix-turn-helix protein [Thermoanaerobacter kivui]